MAEKTYNYICLDSSSNQVTGSIAASDKQQAAAELARRGYSTVALNRSEPAFAFARSALNGEKPLDSRTLYMLSARMEAMSQGLGIHKTLALVTEQSRKQTALYASLNGVRTKVDKGFSFSEAMEFDKRFPPFFKAMVEIGQKSGDLPAVFAQLADYYEWEDKTRRGIKSALIYPVIVTVLLILAVVFALRFVIPAYAQVYEAMGVLLPAPTRLLIAAADFLTLHIKGIVLTVLVFILAGGAFLRSSAGITFKDYTALNIPLFKKISRALINYRVAKAAGIMLNQGARADLAVQAAFEAASSPVLEIIGKEALSEIQKGSSISAALSKITYFDSMLINAVKTGEETGRLPFMLDTAARYGKNELERMVKDFSAAIEPVITIILGVLICAVLMAVVLPSFSLM